MFWRAPLSAFQVVRPRLCFQAASALRPPCKPPAFGWCGRPRQAANSRLDVPDGAHGNRQRDTLARLPIGELSAWHLLASCDACRADRILPVDTLVARYGSESSLIMLVPRLRCGTCRRPPAEVRLRSKLPDGRRPEPVEVFLRRRPR